MADLTHGNSMGKGLTEAAMRATALAALPFLALLVGAVWWDLLPLGYALLFAVALAVLFITLFNLLKGRERRFNLEMMRLRAEAVDASGVESQRAIIIDRLIDSLPDPLMFLSRELKIIRANAASGELSSAAVAGRHLSEAFRNPDLFEAMRQALDSMEAQSVPIHIKGQVETSYLARIMPIQPTDTNGDRNNSAILLAMQDITSELRTERLRADFVANVSHELRTPLTSLIGFIETLRGPAKDDADAAAHFLEIMQDQSDRMLRLIEDLLSLSRIEMDEHSRPTTPADIPAVLEKVCDVLAMKAEKSGIAIKVACQADLPQPRADRDQLIQVFQNLIDNAIKYGRDDSEVEVTVEVSSAAMLTVSVRDHGAGIPAEHLPRLTERFYRIDAARSREMGGTGLGLAIVKHIINRHRGKLLVESREGEGSIFRVQLPVE